MKNQSTFNLNHFFVALLLSMSFTSFAQGNQWTTSVNVGGSGGQPWADWLFDVVSTQEGNYFAVGFAREDEENGAHPDVPAYCLVGPNGNLLRDGVIEDSPDPSLMTAGRLNSVVEANNDSYYSVGWHGSKGILVRVNKSSLDATYFDILPTGFSSGRLVDIVNVIGNGNPYLLLSGQASNGGASQRWVAAYNYDGTKKDEQVFAIQGQFSEESNAIDYHVNSNGTVEIYYASNDRVSEDGGFGSHRRHDADIRVGKMVYDPSAHTFSETSQAFNSILQGPRDEEDMPNQQAVGANTIFGLFPPSISDHYPYGPKYKNTAFERHFDNCNEETPVNGYYIEDWSDGSEDVPYGMVTTQNQIVVSALLNRIIMWGTGTNIALGNDDPNEPLEGGLKCESGPCFGYNSIDYLWGEAYLLFINKSDLSLAKATHLGTWSGGDFFPQVTKTSDGGFAVTGTITGCPQGLSPIKHDEEMMVVKVDANGDVVWREHVNGQSEGACGFGITEAPDGGLVVVGNTVGNGDEDWCIIKLGSDCDYGTANILPNNGNDYILSADETWDTDRNVKARVVVPAGKILRIQGTAAAKTTVRFADSKEVFNFKERYPIGITVQKGGTLLVSNAILAGFDCIGTPKMWDGINVEGSGNSALAQTIVNQGFATFVNSDVLNARQGVVASAVWCGTPAPIVNTYAGTGSQGTTYTSALYHGGPFGGARILGVNSRWIDNKRSAIFMKYSQALDNSRFINCKFLSNGPLADPSEMLPPIANDFNYNEPRGTQTHVSIWSTRAQFTNCDFQGSTGIIPDYRPFGIEGDDPKIVASSGNMKDLKIGIECRSPLGSILGTVNASGITFDNVVQGINLRNSTADQVTGCHFLNIPAPNTFQGLSPVGIFGEFNKGAYIWGNDFHGVSSAQTWGIVEHNTLNQGCDILENQFFGTRVGNQFEGNNGQLFARCNDYTGMGFSGWAAVKNANVGLLPPQGNPIPLQAKADNEFFDFCDGSSDIHIFSEFAFSYFDKVGNQHPTDADCVSDIVNLSLDINDLTPPNCYVMNTPCDPPCRLAQYFASPGTIRDRNIALRGLIHTGFDAEGADLPAQYDNVLSLLQFRNQPEDQILRIGSLASMDRLADAQAANNALNTATAQNAAYKAYLTNILSSGTDLTALPAANYNTAMLSLTAENVCTRAMAENLQYFREGVYHPLVAVNPEGSESRPLSERQEAQSLNQRLKIKVLPNPFSDEVIFDLSGLPLLEQYSLSITDMLGRTLFSMPVNGGLPFKWQTSQISDGPYFYQIRSDKRIVQSGKLLKGTK